MNLVMCLSHSIEEYDQLALLSELGITAASIGGYIDPAHPHDPKRPALNVPLVPEVRDAVDQAGGIAQAQARIPPAVLDWLGDDGVIVYHHLLERLLQQWATLRDWLHGGSARRVIWRTVGQSNPDLEAAMAVLRRDGLEIVRYSPKESNIPRYAGADALIRFYKDPAVWDGWIGDEQIVTTVCQNMKQRDPFTNFGYWEDATHDLPRVPLGVGSEAIGGPGTIPLDEMVTRLRHARAYLYTGTQPASYTLALIEAMMVGIPVISIPYTYMQIVPYGPGLFEGDEIVMPGGDARSARHLLQTFLDDADLAADYGAACRRTAIKLFGKAAVADEWAQFLGVKVPA